MKRLVSMLACIMLVMMLCVACGNKEEDNNKKNDGNSGNVNNTVNDNKDVTIDVAAMADKLLSDVKFVDDMTAVDSVDFFAALFSVEAADVKEQKSYTSTGATAELISAVKCTDKEAAKRVKTAFEAYTKDLSSQYADYKPEECTKLDNPVIKVYNEYVIICVSDDNDTAAKTIEGQVK